MAKQGNKKKKKKSSGALAALILIALLAVVVYLVLHNYVFVIRRVEVRGAENLADADVIRLAQIPMGKPLGELNPDSVKRAVESTGQLAFDGVDTQYPDTVVLHVHTRSLAALVQNAGTLLGLDRDGCVIAQYNEVPQESAVFITGLSVNHYTLGSPLGTDANTLEAVQAILKGLQAVDASALVSEMNVANPQQLCLYSRTGIQVVLGSKDNMEKKLLWMKSALLDLESRGETRGRLDVSSADKADFRPQ